MKKHLWLFVLVLSSSLFFIACRNNKPKNVSSEMEQLEEEAFDESSDTDYDDESMDSEDLEDMYQDEDIDPMPEEEMEEDIEVSDDEN